MAEVILFVFEGKKTEETVLRSFRKYYLLGAENTLIHATYNTSIYALYEELKKDEFLDLVEVLRDKDLDNASRLKNISRDDISEIYLFFDYDGHASSNTESKLSEMLEFYNEETENGRLFISYPMVESLKHIRNSVDFSNVTVAAKENINYKKLVSDVCCPSYKDMTALSEKQWENLLSEHCKKANFVVNGYFSLPKFELTQEDIFKKQLSKYITPNGEVAVLSAFPLLVLHYYGSEKLLEMVPRKN